MNCEFKGNFRKFVLFGTAVAFGASACAPVNIVASEPTPTSTPPPTATLGPGFMAYEGTGAIPQFPEYSPDLLQASIIACEETENPDNDCNDTTDKPIRGISLNVKFGKAEDEGETHRIVTNESGFATVSESKPDGYDGWSSLGLPANNFDLVRKDGSIVRVCGGRFNWEGDENQKLTFPYAKENCNKPENNFQNTQKTVLARS